MAMAVCGVPCGHGSVWSALWPWQRPALANQTRGIVSVIPTHRLTALSLMQAACKVEVRLDIRSLLGEERRINTTTQQHTLSTGSQSESHLVNPVYRLRWH